MSQRIANPIERTQVAGPHAFGRDLGRESSFAGVQGGDQCPKRSRAPSSSPRGATPTTSSTRMARRRRRSRGSAPSVTDLSRPSVHRTARRAGTSVATSGDCASVAGTTTKDVNHRATSWSCSCAAGPGQRRGRPGWGTLATDPPGLGLLRPRYTWTFFSPMFNNRLRNRLGTALAALHGRGRCRRRWRRPGISTLRRSVGRATALA